MTTWHASVFPCFVMIAFIVSGCKTAPPKEKDVCIDFQELVGVDVFPGYVKNYKGFDVRAYPPTNAVRLVDTQKSAIPIEGGIGLSLESVMIFALSAHDHLRFDSLRIKHMSWNYTPTTVKVVNSRGQRIPVEAELSGGPQRTMITTVVRAADADAVIFENTAGEAAVFELCMQP